MISLLQLRFNKIVIVNFRIGYANGVVVLSIFYIFATTVEKYYIVNIEKSIVCPTEDYPILILPGFVQ